MGSGLARLVLCLSALMLAVAVIATEDRINKSVSAGLIWSTAKDEADLYRKADTNEASLTLDGNEELDGGFSSLDGMLQWAIGHSDPTKLKEASKHVQRLSPDEIKNRQIEIKELLDKLRTPSDAELMTIAITDLNNSSLSLDDRLRALEELLILVEPVDNANDLNKLGGLVAVIRELDHSEPEIRKLAAWVIGKASQNNPVVQKQALELGALTKLMKMVRSSSAEEATKALYAVSALIRNNFDGQQIFYAESGDLMLQDILSNSSFDIRLQRKSVFLIGDLAECQLENANVLQLPFLSSRVFLKSVVDVTTSADLDLQEKALVAIKNLLLLRTTEAVVFRDFCSLQKALDRMRLQLQQLMEEEGQKDYAIDVESLRRDVEIIFREKLEQKGTRVPT